MSARLNFNEIAYFPWKGKTFNQIVSTLQKNQNSTVISKYNLKLAQPLKIYRKEIATLPISSCSQRYVSVDEMNMPNGYLISNASQQNGLVETLDFNLTNNTTDIPGACDAFNTNSVCLTPAQNALNRVRSSGNLKKTFNANKNNDTYYTSAKQYLESRNRLFAQNQFNYVRKGNLQATAGSPQAVGNIYSPQGTNHCPQFYVGSPITFDYQWCDGSSNTNPNSPSTVTIPVGYYTSIDDINQILIQTMTANKHYYINNSTGNYVYLLSISYNNITQRAVLQTRFTNTILFPTSGPTIYSLPGGSSSIIPVGSINTQGPYFNINNSQISSLLGVIQGQYPTNNIARTSITYIGSTTSSDSGTSLPQISAPIYVPLYYKPNNYQYAQQGAVDSSARITRLKYNTITTNAGVFQTSVYGSAVANALAYSTVGTTYTLKDKMGYPNKCTPVFNK